MALLWQRAEGTTNKTEQQLKRIIVALIVPIGLIFVGAWWSAVIFGLTAVIIAVWIGHFRLTAAMPLAREQLFDKLCDGIIVLDGNGTVIDINQSFRKMFPEATEVIVGSSFEHYLMKWPEWQRAFMQEQAEWVKDDRYYSIKSLPLAFQQAKASGQLIIFSDITKHKLMEQELKRIAMTDSLTNVLNRRYYMELSNEWLHQHATPVSVFIIDIDHFKKINDRFGHQVGDEVIRRFADLCQSELRSSDILGRIGGEEFAVTLPNVTEDDAYVIAERIRAFVESTPIYVDQYEIYFTISIGMASRNAFDTRIDELLKRADFALYEAKHIQRNCVKIAQ